MARKACKVSGPFEGADRRGLLGHLHQKLLKIGGRGRVDGSTNHEAEEW